MSEYLARLARRFRDDFSELQGFAGAHPRFSLEVGKTSGAAVGRQVVERLLRRTPASRAGTP